VNSCTSIIKLQPSITNENGNQTIELPTVKTKILYPGDYWFHDFDLALFPNANPDYLKLFTELNNSKRAIIQYAAHTTIQPYFSTTALIYSRRSDTKILLRELQEELINEYKASNFETEDFGTKAGNFTQLFYNINHPKLKTQARFVEYIGQLKEQTIRIIFWTIDSNNRSLTNESEKIIKTLSMEWY